MVRALIVAAAILTAASAVSTAEARPGHPVMTRLGQDLGHGLHRLGHGLHNLVHGRAGHHRRHH